jgi:transposase InsO family protein
MPFEERNAVELRNEFIDRWISERETITELCEWFGISRKTGYKWIERYDGGGREGLADRSRAPHHHPQQMEAESAAAILAARQQYPSWGARKLRKLLGDQKPEQAWPAASSIGELLKREGLIVARRKRRRTPPYTQPLAHAQAANQVWCADFKGWFRCLDGMRCDPLTITDAYSRYLLRCRAVAKTDGLHVRAIFEAVFRECGLPEAIRTDNGSPFASPAPGGLSRLSMWWLKLGIRHERIEPGCPGQNGRHERMHRTLKAETASPAEANMGRQQARFLRFEREYNELRPHQALGYRKPAELYVGSVRRYPRRLPELEYPAGVHLRKISQQGSLKWKCQRTFLSQVLARETVGLLEVDDELFEVYYGPVMLGWFDGRHPTFVAEAQRKQRRRDHVDNVKG